MLIRRADEMEGRPMEADGAEGVTLRLMVGREDGAPNFALRHFTIDDGGHSPLHRHNYEHENYIVSGLGTLRVEDEVRELRPGDVAFVPPNALHQFRGGPGEPLVMLCLVPTRFVDENGDPSPTPGS